MKGLLAGLMSSLLLALSGAAHTTPILIVDGGQLVGAQNVLVDGTLFDVTFTTGSCIVIFDGCNESSDFDFDNYLDAEAASQALLDQVFLDGPLGSFDSIPGLVDGCNDETGVCQFWSPYEVGQLVFLASAYNGDPGYGDFVLPGLAQPPTAWQASTLVRWVRWTPVAEPSALALIVVGLAAMVRVSGDNTRSLIVYRPRRQTP